MDDVIERKCGRGAEGLAPELSSLSDDELTATFDAAVARSRRSQWRRLAVECEIDRRSMYRTDGTRSLKEWIAVRTGEGERASYQDASVACSLAAHPELSATLVAGRVSVAHIRLLLVLAGLTTLTDAELVAIGETHTVPQLETACRAARRLALTVDTEGHARRHLRWRRDDNGTLYFHGCLHGTDALIVTNLLTAIAEAAGPDPLTGDHAPFDVRCADALVDVCSPLDTTRPDRAEVVLHVPLAAVRSALPQPSPGPDGGAGSGLGRQFGDVAETVDGAGSQVADGIKFRVDDGTRVRLGVAMTWDGTTISTSALHRLLCDSRLRLTIDDLDGKAVGIGRLSKHIPSWLADQVRWRDQACRFPGCEETRWLHNHHIQHWAADGPTDLANLTLLCRTHHKAVHEGPWQVQGNPNGPLTFTGPHHQTLTTHPALPPPRLRYRTRRHRPPRPPDLHEP